MKTSSAKSKGRRACAEARDALLKHYSVLEPDDIMVTPSGVTGEDLRLSPRARALLPFAFEVKNQETIQIWAALAQAETHAEKRPGTIPALIFRRNRSELYITMKLQDFLKVLGSNPTERRTPPNEQEEARQEGQVREEDLQEVMP